MLTKAQEIEEEGDGGTCLDSTEANLDGAGRVEVEGVAGLGGALKLNLGAKVGLAVGLQVEEGIGLGESGGDIHNGVEGVGV